MSIVMLNYVAVMVISQSLLQHEWRQAKGRGWWQAEGGGKPGGDQRVEASHEGTRGWRQAAREPEGGGEPQGYQRLGERWRWRQAEG